MPSFPFLTGFESTHIFGSGTDVLEGTRHLERWRHDLDLVTAAGIRVLRYPVPWHRIESVRGQYDWRWLDEVLAYMRQAGLDPILDPIHHTSFPEWIEGGFAHPEFADLYERFVKELAARYPWVTKYTLFNEPFVTTLFCGKEGIWYPNRRSARVFVRMIVNVGRSICNLSAELARSVPGLQLIHVDTCESHRALDSTSRETVDFLNHRRFLLHDLILGRVDRSHPLSGFLSRNGFRAEERRWFQDHPSRIDVLGLDYYSHSEQERYHGGRRIRWHGPAPRGFAAVAQDYVERYAVPVMLTETNLKGTVQDRLSWLRHMVEECEKLQRVPGVDFRGFCWFPFVDSTDWCSLVCRAEQKVDPVGIYWLDDERWERYGSELSETYGKLARGEMTAAEVTAYRFQPPWRKNLQGYSRFMEHWDWQEPPVARAWARNRGDRRRETRLPSRLRVAASG